MTAAPIATQSSPQRGSGLGLGSAIDLFLKEAVYLLGASPGEGPNGLAEPQMEGETPNPDAVEAAEAVMFTLKGAERPSHVYTSLIGELPPDSGLALLTDSS